jgi:hypothetical protein
VEVTLRGGRRRALIGAEGCSHLRGAQHRAGGASQHPDVRPHDPRNCISIARVEYALLYTFSTTPQTLAAALGVLAAFVLYRLQPHGNTRWQDATELINQFGVADWAHAAPETTLGDLLGAQQYEKLLEELEHRYALHQPPQPGEIVPRSPGFKVLGAALSACTRFCHSAYMSTSDAIGVAAICASTNARNSWPNCDPNSLHAARNPGRPM